MCSVTGAMAKGVSVGKCVAPLATFYCGRNIAHNVSRLCVVVAFTKLNEPHGFAAFGLAGWLCGLLNGVSGET